MTDRRTTQTQLYFVKNTKHLNFNTQLNWKLSGPIRASSREAEVGFTEVGAISWKHAWVILRGKRMMAVAVLRHRAVASFDWTLAAEASTTVHFRVDYTSRNQCTS